MKYCRIPRCTLHRLCALSHSDRMYSALPLYHASGGMMAVSACLQSGATLVHRPRFSASAFSHDVAVHRCVLVPIISILVGLTAETSRRLLDALRAHSYCVAPTLGALCFTVARCR